MKFVIGRRETLDGIFPRSKVCPSSSSPSEVESLDSKVLETLLYSVFFMMDAKGNHNPSLAKREMRIPKTFLGCSDVEWGFRSLGPSFNSSYMGTTKINT